mmetsp:Transcript_38858/g.103183  ORF Transcript_38858/g.103183 Transcript_38858/m.103183 type:complete len:281 (-) Transcript_38858:502-1344(-)
MLTLHPACAPGGLPLIDVPADEDNRVCDGSPSSVGFLLGGWTNCCGEASSGACSEDDCGDDGKLGGCGDGERAFGAASCDRLCLGANAPGSRCDCGSSASFAALGDFQSSLSDRNPEGLLTLPAPETFKASAAERAACPRGVRPWTSGVTVTVTEPRRGSCGLAGAGEPVRLGTRTPPEETGALLLRNTLPPWELTPVDDDACPRVASPAGAAKLPAVGSGGRGVHWPQTRGRNPQVSERSSLCGEACLWEGTLTVCQVPEGLGSRLWSRCLGEAPGDWK